MTAEVEGQAPEMEQGSSSKKSGRTARRKSAAASGAAKRGRKATAFRRRHIGMIYQHFNLFPDLTLEENVAVPLMLEGRSGAEVDALVRQALERVGLGARRDHLPTEVSGGEAQRAAIARALVNEPGLVRADEPTGNLDSATGLRVLEHLRRVVDEERRTILLVTHDPVAAGYAHRIARLRDGAFETS